jgi:hypothetical protein
MTMMTWRKVLLMVSTLAVISTTGCTVTLGDHLTVSSPANPGTREAVPHTSGASLAYDDHPARGS